MRVASDIRVNQNRQQCYRRLAILLDSVNPS